MRRLMFGVVLAPWVVRNLVTFTDTTYISTGAGLALSGANCNQTYYGSNLGSWSYTSRPQNSGAATSLSSRHETNKERFGMRGRIVSRLPVVDFRG